jgi:G3E family GTPase
MDDEIAESYLLDSILTLVDAKHADEQLNTRQEARRQIGFADQIFISKADLVDDATLQALIHRVKHMNPRAPQHKVHFGEVPLADVFDLRGFNLNAKLDIDPGVPEGRRPRPRPRSPRSRPRARRSMRPPAPPCPRRRREVVRVPLRIARSTRPSSRTFLGSIVRSTGRRCCATRACSS